MEKVEEEGERYKRCRQEYRILCKRRKREENLKWEKKAEKVRREEEIWEIVNRKRRKRKKINESIGWKEWKEHFMRLLEGVEERMVRRKSSDRIERDEKKDISKVEVRRAIEKLRDDKAAGLDGIPNEMWRYGGKGLRE